MTIETIRSERAAVSSLSRGAVLNERESRLLATSAARPTAIGAGHEIAAIGTVLDHPKFILSGWVGIVRFLEDGRRQIVDLHVAGEITAFDMRPGARGKGAYVCLTPVWYVDVALLVEQTGAEPGELPGLAAALRVAEDESHSRLFDQVVRVGRMLAHERMAHLALDLYHRHHRVGLCTERGFPMPLTQEMLGDVLGLSTVHVNRTLQQFRRDGLLRTLAGRWQIMDMGQLGKVAAGARHNHVPARAG